MRQCASCAHVWSAPVEYPEPPTYFQNSAHTRTGKNPAVVAIIIGGVLFFGVMIAVLGAVTSPSSDHGSDFKPPVSETGPAPETMSPEASSASVTQVLHGVNGDKPWWVLKYTNTGTATIARPVAQATFTVDGKQVHTQSVYARIQSLPPNAETWILVVPTVAATAEGSFAVQKVEAPKSYSPIYAEVDVIKFDITKKSERYMHITGEVLNTQDVPLKSVYVFAAGYDESGVMCSYADGYIGGKGISKKGAGDFKLYAGTWQTETLPVRWELTAWGWLDQ